MDNSITANAQGGEQPFVLTRIFNAPPALVFRAWTEPEHFKRWWGPEGFTTPEARIDLRVGGQMVFCMRSPEDQDFWAGGTYREIQPPSRLVYTDYFCDPQGNPVPPSEYGMPAEWPHEVLTTVDFEQLEDGSTKMTLQMDVAQRVALLVQADQGWGSSFDKLADYLSNG